MNKYIYPQWPAAANVKAASTTRLAGYSASPCDSFNLGDHVGDEQQAVLDNRRLLQQELCLPGKPQWMNQVHGTDVFYVAKSSDNVPTADALWSDQCDCVLTVMTADCLPVLLAAKNGNCIATIHGGWRGLVGGVIQRTVQALPVPPEDLVAWLGPAIGPQAFEVGAEVRDAFVNLNVQYDNCFVPTQHSGKYLADIFAIGRYCLADAGVDAVCGGERCTYQDPQHFFSYRRDSGNTGRMASLIWIEQT
ncbi:MAG: peptidoglycan editing factor PgeF [Pseudomonadota bacterium]